MSRKRNKKDPFIRLKYIAYVRNYMPFECMAYADLVRYAKNSLCLEKGILYEDSIWDKYSEEAILVEFYSVRMYKNEEFKADIEAALRGRTETDDISWMDKKIKEYDENREKTIKEAEFRFSPEDL